MTTESQVPAQAASQAPKAKKSASEEIAGLKARIDEVQSQLDDAAATIKRQAQSIELLSAEKAAWVADEGLRQTAGNELLNELNGLRALADSQGKEITRLRSDLKNAGSTTAAAEVTANNETIDRLNKRVAQLEAENAKLRQNQGSYTALTYAQVRARVEADGRTKFMAISPYDHGTFRAVRGQTFEARLFPHLAEHVRNGLLLVVMEDAISGAAA